MATQTQISKKNSEIELNKKKNSDIQKKIKKVK